MRETFCDDCGMTMAGHCSHPACPKRPKPVQEQSHQVSNNPPDVIIGISREDAERLIEQCDASITFGLESLQTVSRGTAEKLVEIMEFQKRIKAAVNKGLED